MPTVHDGPRQTVVSVSTRETWRLGRRPILDGLRGVAILLVLANHLTIPGMVAAGPVGVSVFFTLSGFLITSLLLEERRRSGSVALAAFYSRRVRRLVPGLLVYVAVATAVAISVHGRVGDAFGDALAVIAYTGNWRRAAGDDLGWLNITWSLSVEEQFYLLWPPVFLLFAGRGRRVLLGVALGGAAISLMAKVALWELGAGRDRVYFATDVQAGGLLLGCALALVMHGSTVTERRVLGGVTPPLLLLVAVAALPGEANVWVTSTAVAPLCSAWAIYAAVSGHSHSKLLEGRWLVLVGQRSYGLYLWHWPATVAVLPLAQKAMPLACAVMLTAAASWLMTLMSWRYVERPFLAGSHYDAEPKGPAGLGIRADRTPYQTTAPSSP